jgi:hypothetical protein
MIRGLCRRIIYRVLADFFGFIFLYFGDEGLYALKIEQFGVWDYPTTSCNPFPWVK